MWKWWLIYVITFIIVIFFIGSITLVLIMFIMFWVMLGLTLQRGQSVMEKKTTNPQASHAEKLYNYDSSNKFGTKNHWYYINLLDEATREKARKLEKAYSEKELEQILKQIDKVQQENKGIAERHKLISLLTIGGLARNLLINKKRLANLASIINNFYSQALKEGRIKPTHK